MTPYEKAEAWSKINLAEKNLYEAIRRREASTVTGIMHQIKSLIEPLEDEEFNLAMALDKQRSLDHGE